MRLILAAVVVLLFNACRSGQPQSSNQYPNNVGDIEADPKLDDPSFTVCRDNRIPQYYSIESGFEGEKPAIVAFFQKNFVKNKKHREDDGYITIRFVVNCMGQTGRFRMQEMSPDLTPKQFSPALSEQLLQLVKALQGWKPGQRNGVAIDYYQYLTFKIKDGEIIEILP
jgi:hypothetical protein